MLTVASSESGKRLERLSSGIQTGLFGHLEEIIDLDDVLIEKPWVAS